MMCRASSARSRAVIIWFGSGQPVELAKVELVRPSSLARSVMAEANSGSEPFNASATAMQASLPDCTMMP